ncbi:MAG: sugar ABC transporter permease [Burkholderiales bacterium]|nr:sugar ABC transporter permease [Burkholderiales bacterium]
MKQPARPRRLAALRDRWLELAFAAPVLTVIVGTFVGTLLLTLALSFTASRTLPVAHWLGLAQYARLWHNERWLSSVANLLVYAFSTVGLSLAAGIAIAIALDRSPRVENLMRTVVLYPQATSFIVTGLVWQWLMTPSIGVQAALKLAGWDTTARVWLSDPTTAIFAVALAASWQASGLVAVIVLSAIKGIDRDTCRAAALDGVPAWRIYTSVVLPQVRGAIVAAALLLLMGSVKTYDLVVAMTHGGPGTATELPAKFTMAYLWERQNVGLASASATSLLLAIVVVMACGALLRRGRKV